MRPNRRWLGHAIALLLFGAVLVLLYRYARSVRWRDVTAALASYDLPLLAGACTLVVLSYALYASYDLLAQRYAGHRLRRWRVLQVAAVSYACNLNLGALIGGAAFRYRLYMRSGLGPATVTRILAFSVTTNWLGYIALAGIVFAARDLRLPPAWSVGSTSLQVFGIALLATASAYLVACAVAHDRVWRVRGHEIRLPPLGLALLQLAVSTANWATIAAIVFALLQGRVPYAEVLGVMLVAAIAGAMTHVPAGLGVIELVVLALLGGRLPEADLLAALLVYRALYYIAPLLVALLTYARFEATRALPRVQQG